MSAPMSRELEDLAQELDMLVFRLERGSDDVEKLLAERVKTRRALEKLRDSLRDLSMGI